MAIRILEIIFFLYFASHIPITLCIDLQALLPGYLFPQPLRDLMKWYAAEFRDPMVLDPPQWFRAFILLEAVFQTPFFPVAAYAFLKGGCTWIRTPAIVYSTHVATTLVPILAHILFYQFPMKPHPGPQTMQERWRLVFIYLPYLLVPVLLLLTMLLSSTYNPTSKSGLKPSKSKKKN
ncbi:sigma intracellular receptor 2 [Centropristis striata]|uniref:sigma intracellular receptor 2 n=1 Tax=Centropristis striata TaxID=184440 RepID=UPI0027E017D4|nr:sigma intracellular receptor 2 [Centropristis striata]